MLKVTLPREFLSANPCRSFRFLILTPLPLLLYIQLLTIITPPMKLRPLVALLALAFSVVSPVVAAETAAKPAATQAAFKGAFAGKWQGQNNIGGVLKLDFKAGADAKLGADVLFVYEGTDVRAQTKSLKVEGDKIELVITWEIQGTFASTKLVGSLKGNDIAGTYESTAAEEPATGKWSVSRS
jgi:hypothetical protein